MPETKSATQRALRTAAQTAIGSIGATAVFSKVDWAVVGRTVLSSAVLSYLTSLSGLPECKPPQLAQAGVGTA
jgi:hypothetical protein